MSVATLTFGPLALVEQFDARRSFGGWSLSLLSQEQLDEFMWDSVSEAKDSLAEDDLPRPRVGALLVDGDTGEVLVRAHRGERPGAHAEYVLFAKAEELGIDARDKVLFTTLEPCVRRGVGKVPCVERVEAANLRRVYIGTLDPNPFITGRGEMQLQYGSQEVGRYSIACLKALRALNKVFFDQYRSNHVISPPRDGSLLPSKHVVASARKGSDRNRLLQSTLDMISATEGDVHIWAGDLSWLREAYVPLLSAAALGREFQFLTFPPDDNNKEQMYSDSMSAARAIGEVRRAHSTPAIKLTSIGSAGELCAVVIDQASSYLFTATEDKGLLAVLGDRFMREWESATPGQEANNFEMLPVDKTDLIAALRTVSQYANATMEIQDVDLTKVHPMTRNLERFKIARLRQLTLLTQTPGFELAAVVKGSPWPITPPVIEETPSGKLVIMDGTHRAYSAIENGNPMLKAIVVKGVTDELPATPVEDWNRVRSHMVKLPREQRYADYKKENFRLIRYAFARLTR